MRCRADSRVKEKILEISRQFQVVHNDRWSQRQIILPIFMTFHDLPCLSNIVLQPSHDFYNFPITSITCSITPNLANLTRSAYSYHYLTIIEHLRLIAFKWASAHNSMTEMYQITISFCLTFSRINCQRTSMPFVFWLNLGFSVNEIALLLSARRSTGWLGK